MSPEERKLEFEALVSHERERNAPVYEKDPTSLYAYKTGVLMAQISRLEHEALQLELEVHKKQAKIDQLQEALDEARADEQY